MDDQDKIHSLAKQIHESIPKGIDAWLAACAFSLVVANLLRVQKNPAEGLALFTKLTIAYLSSPPADAKEQLH